MDGDGPRPVTCSIVLFDGVCNLCCASVRFIIERDPRANFRFAALQSEFAAQLLSHNGLSKPRPDSIVLLEHGRAFVRSGAALRIARRLRWPWPVLYVFVVLPRPVRDVIYAFVSNRRYRWFGRREACMVPTPEIRSRFIGW